jgi:hypothetical protein
MRLTVPGGRVSDELAGRVSMMTGKEELLKDGDVLIFCMRNYSYSDIGNIYIYICYIYMCVFIYIYICVCLYIYMHILYV